LTVYPQLRSKLRSAGGEKRVCPKRVLIGSSRRLGGSDTNFNVSRLYVWPCAGFLSTGSAHTPWTACRHVNQRSSHRRIRYAGIQDWL